MSTWLDDLSPELRKAYKVVGNQPTWALKHMVRALSSLSWLNTPEDKARLAAAKYILSHKK